jgi:hypothetical protein
MTTIFCHSTVESAFALVSRYPEASASRLIRHHKVGFSPWGVLSLGEAPTA